MATVEEQVLTLEEYLTMTDDGRRTELVRGRILELPPTNDWHGVVCNLISRRLGNWVEDRNLGRTVSNDSGIVTRRGPDTLRGADLAY
jgi:Uma2 family endonuclease